MPLLQGSFGGRVIERTSEPELRYESRADAELAAEGLPPARCGDWFRSTRHEKAQSLNTETAEGAPFLEKRVVKRDLCTVGAGLIGRQAQLTVIGGRVWRSSAYGCSHSGGYGTMTVSWTCLLVGG